MKRWTLLLGLPVILLLGLVSPAQAITVNFDDMLPTPGVVTSDLQVQDYLFSSSHGHAVTNLSGYGASNGSNYLVMLVNGTSTERIVSTTGRGSFDLLSLDLGGWLNFGTGSRQLELTGYRTGGTVVRTLLDLQPASFQTYAISGFSELVAVELRADGSTGSYYIAMDKLQLLSPVPEPAAAGLWLCGLLGLASLRRRYRRVAA